METKLISGAIFSNDKRTKDTQPNYRGTINVDGVDKEIALWLKVSAKGTSYFSVAIKEPYVKDAKENTFTVDNSNQDLPF